jgi:hypothetical protein
MCQPVSVCRLQLQFLLTPDRKHVKLNDFNRMEVMLWEDTDQAYCRYKNGPGQGDVCYNEQLSQATVRLMSIAMRN